MFPIYLWVMVGAGSVVLAAYLLNHYLKLGWNTSWPVLAAFTAASVLVLSPFTSWAGYAIGKNSALTYNEFWNGIETGTSVNKDTCEYDGSCRHTYDCDPYPVTTHSTDANGNPTSETHTEWHSCPYVTSEYTWVVHTTLGDNVVGDRWFPENPGKHKYRAGVGLPNVPSGTPAEYTAAKARLAAGTPGGVTKPAKYKNYFLASEDPVLSRHSAALATYRDAKLLPDTARYAGMMKAPKLHVVGNLPPGTNYQQWAETVGRLNGALGIERQGDLHVVLVTSEKVTDPDEYTSALRAHWWSEEMGDDPFAKNGIAVVLGSAPGSSTVEWARTFTGMPEGNRALEAQLDDELPGVDFTPDVAIGAPSVSNVGSPDPVFVHSDGVVNTALWGTNAYQRVCMGCDDEDDIGSGYVYLASNVDAPTGAKVATVVIGWLLNAALMAALLALLVEWDPLSGADTRRLHPWEKHQRIRNGLR